MARMVVSISHTNYCIRSAGTEKFIRNLSDTLQKNDINHLHFFSFYHDVVLPFSSNQKKVGVNYNDRFVGVYNYSEIIEIIKWFEYKENQNTIAVHIEHLLNHDLEKLVQIITDLSVPVYFFVHDYFCVCKELKLVDSEGSFCGVSAPSENKCSNCHYKEDGITHYIAISDFLNEIDGYLKYLITPSAYVAEKIKTVFPKIKNRVVVRGHLQTSGTSMYSPIGEKTRIAYVGGPFKEKGYCLWKKMVSDLSSVAPDKYSYYYLGSAKDEIKGVKSVYVSTAEQGDDAMVKAIADNKIECAFVWPIWAETYSYVYYELAVNGVFILTNTISGNICDQVNNNQNGMVFQNYETCLKWLMDTQTVKKTVNEYRLHGKYRPSRMFENIDLSLLVEQNIKEKHYNGQEVRPQKDIIQTYIYKHKYRKLLS